MNALSIDTIKDTKFYTIDEVADLLGAKPATVRRWVVSGAIESYKIGPRTRKMTREQVEAYLNRE